MTIQCDLTIWCTDIIGLFHQSDLTTYIWSTDMVVLFHQSEYADCYKEAQDKISTFRNKVEELQYQNRTMEDQVQHLECQLKNQADAIKHYKKVWLHQTLKKVGHM